MTVRPSDLTGKAYDAFRMWTRTFGLSETAALKLVAEDFPSLLPAPSDHDRLVSNFRTTFGMSEQAAEIAARGRGGGSFRPVSESAQAPAWAKAKAALDEMSDQEIDQMFVEEQRRRKAKKTPASTSKAPAKSNVSRSTVISEINGRVVK